MEDERITIKFELTDEVNHHYQAESTMATASSLGYNALDIIGEQLNNFLRQCGYIRKNNNIFMEDITDEEYDALAGYLSEIRSEKGDVANDD